MTHVAMESTGEYWKPVYWVREEGFEVLLVNAAHIKNAPGRKTDAKDGAIAQLLECGLLQGSFVPPREIREVRDLTRYCKTLVQQRTEEVLRLHGILQRAGIQLSSVASNIMEVSGRAMLDALVEGTKDAEAVAELARGRLRQKIPLLKAALEGHFTAHQCGDGLTHVGTYRISGRSHCYPEPRIGDAVGTVSQTDRTVENDSRSAGSHRGR